MPTTGGQASRLPSEPSELVVRAARVLTPHGVLEDAVVTIDGEVITGVDGPSPCREAAERGAADQTVRFDEGWLLPAFVDVHCHGGDGASFSTTDPEELLRAARFHQRHGTTVMLASLVSADVATLCAQLGAVADVVEAGDASVIGAHVEGPFLSQRRRGAQNPAALIAPDVAAFERMYAASRGTMRMLTIAPELPGAHAVIDAAVAAGVVVAVGHTDATYAETRAAFVRGASAATHLCNGMAPLHHREPGPVLAALDAGAWCELIVDGHHVHPAVVRLIAAAAPERLVLVTDAISAAGAADGTYRLGDLDVHVAGGRAELADGSSLAGSVLTMDVALCRAVEAGVDLAVAAAAASAHPAAALGFGDRMGAIAVGRRADLVWVDDALALRAVMSAGRWMPAP